MEETLLARWDHSRLCFFFYKLIRKIMLLYVNQLKDNSRHYILKYEIGKCTWTYFRYFRKGRSQAHKTPRTSTFSVYLFQDNLDLPKIYSTVLGHKFRWISVSYGTEIMFSIVMCSEELQLGALTKNYNIVWGRQTENYQLS